MLSHEMDGIPYYINPLVGANTLIRYLKGTPQEYVVADSVATIENALKLKAEEALV